jgi:nicotinate-nucleotide adenylyltransferase
MRRWVKIPRARRAAEAAAAVRDRPAASARGGAPARRRVIGLLGGSFNPAHDGHRHISLMALKRLGLDEVWWMVSPQNPLKPVAGMAPFARRLAGARAAGRHPRIKATDIEVRLGSSYTAETLTRLVRRLPRLKFVWLMGADNLRQIDQWRDWPQIFRRVLVAVFARPTYSLRALAGKAACRFARFRMSETAAHKLARAAPPRWVFLTGPQSPLSATAIRAALQGSGRPKSPPRAVTNRQPFRRKVKSG